MTQKERIVSIINTHNAILKYYDYILKQNCPERPCAVKEPLNEDDIYRIIFSFIQLDLLFKKDSITKRVDGKVELYIDDYYLEKFLSTIAKKEPDGRFTISDVTETKEELISIIRHKLAHADYYYSTEKKAVILLKQRKDTETIKNKMKDELISKYSVEDTDDIMNHISKKLNKKFEEIEYDQLEMEIPIEKIINFYEELQEDLYTSYNEKVYTRNIIVNIASRINKKVLKTEQDVLNFIKLFVHKQYKLSCYDNKKIMPQAKDLLNLLIYLSSFYAVDKKSIKELKADDGKIKEDMEETCHHLVIENKKIKDKETVNKIVKALLLYKDLDETKVDKDVLLYTYESVINKILNNRYGITGIDRGICSNIKILKNILKVSASERDELFNFEKPDIAARSLILTDYEEIAATIMLIWFTNIYGYPLEKIYKNDKNYHLVRNHLLDFGKLNLDEFIPSKMNLEKKGLNEINKDIKKKEESIEKNKKSCESFKEKYEELLEKESLTEEHKKGLNFYENQIAKKKRELINYKRQLFLLEYKRKLIREDYGRNYDHFRNLEIIEGIRNSLFHGNVKILNNGMVSNFFELELEFTNIYKDNEEFKIKVTLGKLIRLFEVHNISAIEKFLSEEFNLTNEESCFVKIK